MTREETAGEKSFNIDYIFVNNSITSSLLIHFLRINNTEIEKGDNTKPKEDLIITTKKLLSVYSLRNLPVIFCCDKSSKRNF